MEENDCAYYGRRAARQFELARAASDPNIKKIHLELASKYATLLESSRLSASGKAVSPRS